MKRRWLALTTLALLCACDDKMKEVRQPQLEKQMREQIAEKGKYTPPVFCPGGLDAYVGAQTICYMPIAGRDYDVTARVTSIDGSKVQFDIEVANDPRPEPPSTETRPN